MKNIFKLMGIAVLACGMMVACNKDNNDDNNGNGGNGGNGGNQQEEQIPDGIKVTFGETTWTATATSGSYLSEYNAVTVTAFEVEGNLPYFDEAFIGAEVGTVSENASTQDGSLPSGGWTEYAEQTRLQDQNGSYYGDWWALESNTEVKAIDLTALTITAKMYGTMFSALEALVNQAGVANAPTTTYNVTVGNFSLEAAK